jgi:uncharacterized protein YbjT (DUF2867 family)
MFVVAGVTGNTGSVVAETLLERKQRIRVIVRTPEKGEIWQEKGAEVAVASLEDSQALANAFDGAAGAYLLVPPNYKASDYLEDRRRTTDALATAVEVSGLPHVVFLSSIGAHLATGTGPIQALHYAERRLVAIARSLTILRAPYVMENCVPVLGAARIQGSLPSFFSPGRKIPMIATRDIGHMAAECLLDRCKGKRVLELLGPAEYSPEDVAKAVGRHLGREVSVQQLPLTAVVPTFTSIGFTENVARLFEEMYRGMETGRIRFEGQGAAHPRGLVTLAEGLSGRF